MEGIKDVEEVINVSVKSCVAAVIKVIGVDTAGANEVIKNDFVAAGEVREHALPCWLVGAEAVSEDDVFVAGAFYTDIECVEDGSTAHGLKVKGVAVDRNDCLCFGFGYKRCVFWRLAFGNLGYEPKWIWILA